MTEAKIYQIKKEEKQPECKAVACEWCLLPVGVCCMHCTAFPDHRKAADESAVRA